MDLSEIMELGGVSGEATFGTRDAMGDCLIVFLMTKVGDLVVIFVSSVGYAPEDMCSAQDAPFRSAAKNQGS